MPRSNLNIIDEDRQNMSRHENFSPQGKEIENGVYVLRGRAAHTRHFNNFDRLIKSKTVLRRFL
jgi:hypothetical protein